MSSILRVHNSLHWPSLTFYVQHTKNQAAKKWLLFELICAVYSVQYSTCRSNHSLCMSLPKFTDLICSVHHDPTHKKVAPFELISAVYIVTWTLSNLVQILIWGKNRMHPAQLRFAWLAGCIIITKKLLLQVYLKQQVRKMPVLQQSKKINYFKRKQNQWHNFPSKHIENLNKKYQY